MSRRDRGKTSQWVRERERDPHLRAAREGGYRSRAALKLIAIDDAFRILSPGMTAADLGCAPGGWSQVLAERCGCGDGGGNHSGGDGSGNRSGVIRGGTVVGVDLLPTVTVAGVVFVRGDFCDEGVAATVAGHLGGRADVVVSDMSPDLSGIAVVDQARAAELGRAAFAFAGRFLAPGGAAVVKCFAGGEFAALRAEAGAAFGEVACYRPPASRAKSREVYLIARGFGKRRRRE